LKSCDLSLKIITPFSNLKIPQNLNAIKIVFINMCVYIYKYFETNKYKFNNPMLKTVAVSQKIGVKLKSLSWKTP